MAAAGINEPVWRVKAVTEAKPDALARALTLLEIQELVPLLLVARRAAIQGLATTVIEIEIELAAPDFAPGGFSHFVAILAELPTVLSVVVSDPLKHCSGSLLSSINETPRDES